MVMRVRPLVVGNWKMNGLSASIVVLDRIIAGESDLASQVSLMICPPATLLAHFAARAKDSDLAIGAQDCYAEPAGAFTGDISAEMLADAGAEAVIVGHSERRHYHHETSADVHAKALAAWRAGLTAIVCIGEERSQREAGNTLAVIGQQFDGSVPNGANGRNLVVAYEPVWSIGTGLTPTAADIADVHRFIRGRLVDCHGEEGKFIRILYGGSVKPSNSAELMAVEDVDGALVGGASLKAEEFLAIASVYR